MGGTFRIRFEGLRSYFGNRYGHLPDEGFRLIRLRVHLEHRRPGIGLIRAEVQDARGFGLPVKDSSFQGRNHPYRDFFDLNQLYWEARPGRWSWRLGRQSVSFADRRLFGPGDWGNTGRYVWDAAAGSLLAGGVEASLLVGRAVRHDPGRWPNGSNSSTSALLFWNRLAAAPRELAAFYLRRKSGDLGSGGAAGRVSHSLGYWLAVERKQWGAKSLLAVQRGMQASKVVRAWGWMGAFTWKPGKWRKTELEFQHVAASGDSDPTDAIDGTFDGLFSGADTVLYGWMNLCFWRNLMESRMSLVAQPFPKVGVRLEYHRYRLQQARDAWYGPIGAVRQDPSGSSGRDLGHELDLVIRAGSLGSTEILGGGGVFFPGEFVRRTGPAPRGGWMFVQVSIPFSVQRR